MREFTGGYAVRFQIDAEAGAQCAISSQHFENVNSPGISEWFSRVGDPWFAYGGYRTPQTRVQIIGPMPVDTNPPRNDANVSFVDAHPWNFTTKSTSDTFILFFGHLAKPAQIVGISANETLSFAVVCPPGTHVKKTGTATEVMPFVLENLNGTVGLTQYFKGAHGLYAQASINRTFKSPEVYFRFDSWTVYEAGQLDLTSPAGDRSWVLYGQGGGVHGEQGQGSPGQYRVSINDAGADQQLWGIVLGFVQDA